MPRSTIRVIVADIVLLIVEYLIIQDVQWRVSYAASPHANVSGYTPSFSYSLLTQVFTMSGGPIPLVSPVTLDWTQVIALTLLIINGWFVYDLLKARGVGAARTELPTPDPLKASGTGT